MHAYEEIQTLQRAALLLQRELLTYKAPLSNIFLVQYVM